MKGLNNHNNYMRMCLFFYRAVSISLVFMNKYLLSSDDLKVSLLQSKVRMFRVDNFDANRFVE